MATVKVEMQLSSTVEEIDLVDFGHEEHIAWQDLTEDEKRSVEDYAREQTIILINDVKNI